MSKKIYIATGPNGEQFKRSTASRTYTHCVIVRESYENARSRAHKAREQDVKEYRQHVVWARDGYEPSAWMHKPDWRDPSKTTAEVFREEGKQSAIKWLEGKPATAEEYADQLLDEHLSEVEQKKREGYFDRFTGFVGWCGRPDLAQKLAAQTRSPRFDEVLIVDAVEQKR